MEYLNKYVYEIDQQVEFYAEVELEDHGIGSYDFWGQQGYDTNLVPKCQNIEWSEKLFTKEQNAIIDEYLDANWERMSEEIEINYNHEDFT